MKLETTNNNFPFSFFNVFQLLFLKFYLNVLDSKEATKEQITKSFTLFNYFCFWLSIFPFIWFIFKLPASTNRSILTNNLPGLNTVSNELFWETLLNNSDYNENLYSLLKDGEINSNSYLLHHAKINNSIQTLINFESLTNKTYSKEFKPRQLSETSLFVSQLDLDEIPNKLESGLNRKEFDSLLTKLNFSSVETEKKASSKFENSTTQNLVLKKENHEQQNLKIAVSSNRSKLKLFKTNHEVQGGFTKNEKDKQQIKSKEIQNWLAFSQASEVFNKHSRSTFVQNFSNFVDEIQNQDGLLETGFIRPRFMTGYSYPDMNETGIWRLNLSSQFKREPDGLTVAYYPKSIYLSSVIPSLNLNESELIVGPIYDIGQATGDAGLLMYVNHDSKVQDLAVKNRFQTQTSFFNNVILNNPETTKAVYFFANLNKTDLDKLAKDRELLVEQSEKQHVHLNHALIQTTSFFSLPDPSLIPEEIKNSYNQLLTIDGNSNLISISDLRTNKIYYVPASTLNPNIKAFLVDKNKTSSGVFKVTRNNQISPIFNFSSPLIKFGNETLEYSSNLYKREIGSYWKTKINQTEEFLTINDSINIKSIFSISLLGFLISIFLILKTAYADYAKEFSSYLLDLISSGKGLTLDPSTIEWLNQELGLEEKKGGIRVFPKRFSKKRFTDIAGIKKLLPELSELVWFLRNKGRKFNITPLTSKSILLVGPPGTGKTLLVQALAAEAEVPVVAQSTSVLAGMNQDLTPGDAIRMAFQKARSLAPCILFLDELDSLGLKRDSLLTNNSPQAFGSGNEQLQSLPFFEKTSSKTFEIGDTNDSAVDSKGDYLSNQLRINITNEFNSKKQQEREQVAALTQLLIEIDGVQTNSGILVIGATNRSNVLDPALIRPGRFSKVISLSLPDKAKRIEIFKLHSRQLGWTSTINWDYLAQRTKGFSAGDLSTVANQSAIQAILRNSKHTLETFETAITVLTTYPIETPKLSEKLKDPYFSQRDVYYKVAQTFYNYYADVEGKPAFVELNSRQSNSRHYQILANLNNDKNRLRTRFELENLLTALLSGKVGELLMLLTVGQKTSFYWESDLAKNDFYEATKLVVLMMQDWYLYSNYYQQQKFLTIPGNQNQFEYRKNEEVFSLFEETVAYLEQQLTNQFNFSNSESMLQKAQWKSDTIQEMSNIDSLFAEWSRFHLPDPQETDRNPEWIPPEEYYHANETKKYFINGLNGFNFEETLLNQDNQFNTLSFSELVLIERDRYIQTLLLSSFNKAFMILENNREILDNVACFLFKHKILRSFELNSLIKSIEKS